LILVNVHYLNKTSTKIGGKYPGIGHLTQQINKVYLMSIVTHNHVE
jgi:hypothetical protein